MGIVDDLDSKPRLVLGVLEVELLGDADAESVVQALFVLDLQAFVVKPRFQLISVFEIGLKCELRANPC